jgi:uncharacterized membrane protein YqgA involved in biofilm formation
MILFGTLLNVAAILLCGGFALATDRRPSVRQQMAIKGILGVLTIIVGLRLTVGNLTGGWTHIGKQLLIVVLSLSLGRLMGRSLHLQKVSNRLGQYAKSRFEQSTKQHALTDGFIVATVLFCVAPLTFLGAIQDGLSAKWQALGIKAVMDGLATLAFVSTFGWSVLMATVPLLAFQGIITLLARYLGEHLLNPLLIGAVDATSGLLVFCVGLVILDLKKVELTDYLPSILVAPLLAWLWPPW